MCRDTKKISDSSDNRNMAAVKAAGVRPVASLKISVANCLLN